MKSKDQLYDKIFRRLIITCLSVCWSFSILAQQDPLYSQYLNNMVSVNPAYAGSSDYLSFVSLHRQQWVGIVGAPKTLSLSLNTPLKIVNVGVGLSLIYDELGPIKQTGVYVDYAYHVKIAGNLKLAMGAKGGFNSYNLNLIDLVSHSPDEHIANFGERKLFLPNFGVGVYLYSKRFYLGVSSPKILQNSLIEGETTLDLENKEERHYFIMGASLIKFGNFLKMKPSFMSRVVAGSPVSVELTNSFIIKDRLWIGGMYRLGDSVGGLIQFQLSPQLRVGYAYDMTQSKLRNQTTGTHEIMVSYDLILSKQQILSPRFF